MEKSEEKFVSQMQVVLTIRGGGNENDRNSLCFLRDGRIVSGVYDKGVVVYRKKTYESDIIIQDFFVSSLCGLRNGCLAYSIGNMTIKILEINENNYKIIHTLKGHKTEVKRLIELQDGRIWSCSIDKTIKVWDSKRNYECVQTLKPPEVLFLMSIVEVGNYIVSAGGDLNFWDKSTYQHVKTVKDVICSSPEKLAKIKNDKVVVVRAEEINVIDISSFKTNLLKHKDFEMILSVCELTEYKLLLGNSRGKIIYFDLSSDKIICVLNISSEMIGYLIKSEDNKLFLSSGDGTVRLLEFSVKQT